MVFLLCYYCHLAHPPKSRKWTSQFQDLTQNASDKLEGWIDEQISENDNQYIDDSSKNPSDYDSYDDWIDSSEEFNRMNKPTENTNLTNARDLDPWF